MWERVYILFFIKEEGVEKGEYILLLFKLIFGIVRNLEWKSMKYEWGYKKCSKFCKEKNESLEGIFEYENIIKVIWFELEGSLRMYNMNNVNLF